LIIQLIQFLVAQSQYQGSRTEKTNNEDKMKIAVAYRDRFINLEIHHRTKGNNRKTQGLDLNIRLIICKGVLPKSPAA
jgi:hypothetical protein